MVHSMGGPLRGCSTDLTDLGQIVLHSIFQRLCILGHHGAIEIGFIIIIIMVGIFPRKEKN